MDKTHNDKCTSYHTDANRNWVNCCAVEFFFSSKCVSHEFVSQSYLGDQWRSSCLVESLLWTLRRVKKMAGLHRWKFQRKGSAELIVIYIRKDLLRAHKAIFLQAVSLVLSWEPYISTMIYRSGHTRYFSHCMWDWIASLGKFKVFYLSKSNKKKRAGLTLLRSGNQSTFPGAPGL